MKINKALLKESIAIILLIVCMIVIIRIMQNSADKVGEAEPEITTAQETTAITTTEETTTTTIPITTNITTLNTTTSETTTIESTIIETEIHQEKNEEEEKINIAQEQKNEEIKATEIIEEAVQETEASSEVMEEMEVILDTQNKEYVGTFTATWYDNIACGAPDGAAISGAHGRTLISYYSVASNYFASGTLLYIECSEDWFPSGTYRVDDTGGMADSVIDFYYAYRSQVPPVFHELGVQSIEVYVIS